MRTSLPQILKILCLTFSFGFSANLFPQEIFEPKPFGESLKKYKTQKSKTNNQPNKSDNDDDKIRVETNLVINDIFVTDEKGKPVLNLKPNDFLITEDNAPQEIEVFSFGENANLPRSIVFILDYSGNITSYTKNSVDAAKAFVEKLNPNDKMAIISDDVRIVIDFTNDKQRLRNGLDGLLNRTSLSADGGRGEQLSSLLAALNEKFTDEKTRPIVIFQSLGGELFLLKPIHEKLRKQFRERDFGFADVRNAVENSRVTIYSVIPTLPLVNVSEKTLEDNLKKMLKITSKTVWAGRNYSEGFIEKYLDWYKIEMPASQKSVIELAEISGGYTDFLESSEDADKVYSKILDVMKNRYILGYYPKNETKDGKRRTVKIEVKNHPEYKITGRKSYFAPTPEK